MKILLVITGLGMGGAEHVVVNLADALVERGHNVKIVYLTGDALVLPENSSVEIVSIGMKSSKDFFKAYKELQVLIKKFKPDVVHSHMVHSNLLSRLVRLTAKIPKLICTSHSSDEGGKIRMLAYRLTDRLADMSTNVSQDAVDAFIEKGAVKPGRMVSILNGIDVEKFSFNRCARDTQRNKLGIVEKKMVLAVGRLDKAKDYPNLLDAISSIKKNREDFKLFIAGDGPLKEELILLVEKLEIDKYVEFLGVRRDIRDLMSAADVYVMSSAWEGLPMVILEAMACERVVVATNCGGIAEAIGSHGFLAEPKNSTLLAQELNKALDLSDAEQSKIGAAARQRIIDVFSLETNVDAYLKLYIA